MTETITMTKKELSRYEIIRKLLRKEINGTKAAEFLKISTRQVRNIKKQVKRKGIKGVIHQSRGRPSNRKLAGKKVKIMEEIVKKNYPDFGPTLASEKLEENHNIKINKETLRALMISWGLWKARSKRKKKDYHSWRKRKEYYGEMEQFDGSYEHWFEERGEECCLLASIDDATSKVTAKFAKSEGVGPVFDFWEEYLRKNGKPLKIYLDRYSTYKQNSKHLFDDLKALTQFQRAMINLDIEVIHAHTPQAKGRIENLFKTLQDRLIKELRLKNINAIKEANLFLKKEFLPKFNKKFSVEAEKKGNLHRKLSKEERKNFSRIFSIQEQRRVRNDFTVRFKNNWFQLSRIQPTTVLRQDTILIEERTNGQTFISLRGKNLKFIKILKHPKKAASLKVTALTRKKSDWKPPKNHPWKRNYLFTKNKNKKVPIN